jgi:hypothetical protein
MILAEHETAIQALREQAVDDARIVRHPAGNEAGVLRREVGCHGGGYVPFIVVGTPGLLRYLRSLGFQTFSPVIDESYDWVVDDDQRLRLIAHTIEAIGNLTREQLRRLRKTLLPVAAHNLRHLQTMFTPMERLLAEVSMALDSGARPQRGQYRS